jgi:hypothetical protein
LDPSHDSTNSSIPSPMVQPDWAFVFKGGVTAIPIAWGPLFPESRGGESGVRRFRHMALRRRLPAVWNKFLGSFEWPQTYLLYHTNDPPARTYCTRAFGRVAHTFISQRHRFFILRGGEL